MTMQANNLAQPVDVLGTILRHADSHRALAMSDAYSAQEAPRLEAAYSAVAELVEAARETLPVLEAVQRAFKAEAGKAGMVAGGPVDSRLRAALAPFLALGGAK